MSKLAMRLTTIGAALVAVALLSAPSAEARTTQHTHRIHKSATHKAQANKKKHTRHARKSRGSRSAHGSVAGTGTGCLPGVLKTRLAQIAAKFGSVQVVSTHRAGATIGGGGKPSYHASCRAVDFNPPSGKYSEVVAWLKANHEGGVGTYSCNMHHIHIDNGPRVRFHHCQ